MKITPLITCLLLASAGMLLADVPREPGKNKYSNLWNNSPFTVKPEGDLPPVPNIINDYTLLGVAPISDGYMVIMLNKKSKQRSVLRTGEGSQDFKILQVIHPSNNPSATRVELRTKTGQTGFIGFDDRYLALKAAPSAKPVDPRTNPPTQATRPSPPTTGGGAREPRRRIVPPKSSPQNKR